MVNAISRREFFKNALKITGGALGIAGIKCSNKYKIVGPNKGGTITDVLSVDIHALDFYDPQNNFISTGYQIGFNVYPIEDGKKINGPILSSYKIYVTLNNTERRIAGINKNGIIDYPNAVVFYTKSRDNNFIDMSVNLSDNIELPIELPVISKKNIGLPSKGKLSIEYELLSSEYYL